MNLEVNFMVKIRLRRMGAKKNPFYRIVVADSRDPRDGRFIEEIGTYNPLTEPSEIKVNAERALSWIKNGAQPLGFMKELLLYIAQNLVDNPDKVTVNEREEEDGEIVLELRVAEGDMGKVIGRQGRIAKEIRVLVKSLAQRSGKKVSVDIVD
jgi:small subunit ribosomal protein S16